MAPEAILETSLEEANFPAEAFDFVNLGAVLEHLHDPGAALERVLGWLKPGGVVHVAVPSSNHLVPRLANAFFRAAGTTYVTNLSPMHPPFHLYEFTLRSFQAHGRRAGYGVARHRTRVCTIYNVPSLLHPPLRWLMERTGTGMMLAVYLRASRAA